MKLSEVSAAPVPRLKLSQVQAAAPAAEPDLLTKAGDVLRGFRDIPQAGSQMLMHALPESVVAKGNELIGAANNLPVIGPATRALGIEPQTTQQYDQSIQQDEQAYQQRRQQAGDTGLDGTRLAGNIIATAPIATATGGAGFVPAVAQGGALGALQPVVDGGENFASDKAKQVALGAGTAGLLNRVGAGVSRVISPNVNPEVQALMDAGITPTPGQIMGGAAAKLESKATSIPLIGDAIASGQRRAINEFNEAAYNRALEPIGLQANGIGRGGLQGVRRALGDAYDNLLPRLNFQPDAQFAQEVNRLRGMAANLPEAQARRFEAVLQDQLGKAAPNGGMVGQTFKGVEDELTRIAKGYRGDASFDNRELGNAIGELLTSMRGNLVRSNPQYAQELQGINLGYANYARLRRAASSVGAESGVFTPAQLQNAVKASDTSVGKGQFATGNALMQDLSEAGKNVLGSKYPDSGTAGRTLLGLAGAGGLAAISPGAVVGGGAASLAYTPQGQRLVAQLLTQRPDIAPEISRLLLQLSPAASAGGAVAVTGN